MLYVVSGYMKVYTESRFSPRLNHMPLIQGIF